MKLMVFQIFQVIGSIALLAGAVTSIKNGTVPFKSGYRLKKKTDPFGFLAIVLILAGGGSFLMLQAVRQVIRYVTQSEHDLLYGLVFSIPILLLLVVLLNKKWMEYTDPLEGCSAEQRYKILHGPRIDHKKIRDSYKSEESNNE